MGRMDHTGFAPAIFVQGNRQNDACDNGCGANVCSDCEMPAPAAKPACGGCADNASYPNSRTNGCSCDSDGATHIYFETCENSKEVEVIGNCAEETLGRVLDVNVILRNVCPGRCSSLGINLSEMDENGMEYARGFRTVSVPAHNARCYQDVQLDAVRFVLPEDRSLQRRRHLIVRTTHHYLDDGSI